MIRIFSLFFVLSTLISCHQNENTAIEKNESTEVDTPPEAPSFFPLGNFIKGQIVDIKNSGINPIKITTVNKIPDTSWIPLDAFEKIFGEFYTPFIDSTSLQPFFIENKFFDQTLNAITLTYTSVGKVPDSIPWKYWNIYIEPENNKITRIFMVKALSIDRTRQLTWIPGVSAKAVTISPNGAEDEINIKWSYK
jgi:hypothetical protein